MRTVLVIGGGAAGMISAIAAARSGAKVIILEQMNRVGKKILATGNGRCNLTNMYTTIDRFHGRNTYFIYGAMNKFGVEKTIEFFEGLGIVCKEEEGGKVYPWSDQASSVLDVLRYELERLGIEERCEAEVKDIKPEKKGFTVILKDGSKVKGDRVIVAAGGKASPNLGSTGSGYRLLTNLGHKLVEPFPALVQLKLNAPFLKALKGVKFIGEAEIEADGERVRKERGEILFTDYGISGPPVFQLSRKAGESIKNKKRTFIELDMFPDFSFEEIKELIKRRLGYEPNKALDFSFIGLLNKRLIPVVIREAEIEDIHKPCFEVSEGEIYKLTSILKKWKIEVAGTQSWGDAQVTAGGIDVRDINPETMESHLTPGLYVAGEILDIDGDCGGFNLQWAWSSGYVAGISAAND